MISLHCALDVSDKLNQKKIPPSQGWRNESLLPKYMKNQQPKHSIESVADILYKLAVLNNAIATVGIIAILALAALMSLNFWILKDSESPVPAVEVEKS